MDVKYVLIKEFECQYGKLPVGSEIVSFRGQVWVNGGPIPPSFNNIFLELIKDSNYVRKVKINKNEF